MNGKVIERVAKLFALAENNPNGHEAVSARERALAVLSKNGMSEKLFRTIVKYRKPAK